MVHSCEIKFATTKTQLEDTDKQLVQQDLIIETLTTEVNDALSKDTALTNDQTVLDGWIKELDADNLTNLQSKITQYNKEKDILKKNIDQIKQDLVDVEIPDLEKLKSSLDDWQIKKDDAIKLVADTTRTLTESQDSLSKVQTIMKKQGNFAKELSDINSLYNVINGNGSNDSKLKLETYVVQNYLTKVLNYANDHFLGELTNNRYTFEISAQGADKRRDHGLDINVFDNDTGAVRSSDTLSGGETFIAALSIALSLSEVVQSSTNGVQIDALFVDEGFGSLDDETLEKAMMALEQIGQNRMVGVISHIESMKNAIGQQILIKKTGNGHSKVEFVTK